MSDILQALETLRPLGGQDYECAGVEAMVREALADCWRPRARVPTETWMRENLVITPAQSAGDAGRPVDLNRNPQARIITEFLADPTARELSLLKSSAAGCTTTVIGAIVHRLTTDPCNILYLIGNADEAKKISDLYMRPFLRQAFGAAVVDDKMQAALHFKVAGIHIFLGSPTEEQLRSKQIGLLIEDESDTMEENLKGGGQDLDTAEKERTKGYAQAKILRLCSPLYAYDEASAKDVAQPMTRIHRHYLRGDRREFRVCCPACGKDSALTPEGMDYEHCRAEDGTYDVDRVRQEVKWKCPECAHRIPDGGIDRANLLNTGHFVATAKGLNRHIWSAQLTDLGAMFGQAGRWGHVMGELLEAEKEGPSKVAAVRRSHLAIPKPQQESQPTRDVESVLKHCADYPRGYCPIIPHKVMIFADVQKDATYFPWTAAAFNARGDLFVIDWGEAQDTAELEAIEKRPIPLQIPDYVTKQRWPDRAEPPPCYVQHCGMDSGHRAKGDEVDPTQMAVYGFCASTLSRGPAGYLYRWHAFKGRGESQLKDRLQVSAAKMDGVKTIPLYLYNDPAYKAELYHTQLKADPRPGAPETEVERRARHLPRVILPRYEDIPVLEDGQISYKQFLRELTAEVYGTRMELQRNGERVEVRKWYVPYGLANNLGDCIKCLRVMWDLVAGEGRQVGAA